MGVFVIDGLSGRRPEKAAMHGLELRQPCMTAWYKESSCPVFFFLLQDIVVGD